MSTEIHPFLRLATPARVSAWAPESRKPWDAETVRSFASASGWVTDSGNPSGIARVVPVTLDNSYSIRVLYAFAPMRGDQALTRNLYTADQMAEKLNGYGSVPAEVFISSREAVE
jgi:hypothetical protein